MVAAALAALETVIAATGPSVIAVRGSWHVACQGYGQFLAAQQGINVNGAQAYDMGRNKLMQGLANGFSEAVRKIDWRIVHASALHVYHDVHNARLSAWMGLKGDARRMWHKVRPPHAKETRQLVGLLKDHGAIAQSTEVDVAGVVIDLSTKRAVLKNRIIAGDATPAEIREHNHITKQIVDHVGQRPELAALLNESPRAQGLLGALALPGMTQVAGILGGVTLVSIGAAAGSFAWGLHEHGRAAVQADHAKEFAKERDAFKASYTFEHAQVVKANESATKTAKLIQAERADSAAAARRDRRRAHDLESAVRGLNPPPDFSLHFDEPSASGSAPTGASDSSGVQAKPS